MQNIVHYYIDYCESYCMNNFSDSLFLQITTLILTRETDYSFLSPFISECINGEFIGVCGLQMGQRRA